MKALKFQVMIVMGSQSDLPVMKKAVDELENFDVAYAVQILSAHRTPQLLEKSVKEWEKNDVKVVIAGAGGAAHLPGMLAAFSVLPVIGVPVQSKSLNGLDSLLSIAQMPTGVPVATVAVNNATNAALLALEILGIGDNKIRAQLYRYKKNQAGKVLKQRKKISKVGIKSFLRSSK